MNSKMKILLSAFGLFGFLWVIGLMMYPKVNPEQRHTGVIIDQKSDELLKKACFDCHSNETLHPWYVKLPLFSIVIAHHINEGREELNFSRWNEMDWKKKNKKLKHVLEEVGEGEMPPMSYKLLHPEARLTEADISALRASIHGIVPDVGGEEATPAGDSDEAAEHGHDK